MSGFAVTSSQGQSFPGVDDVTSIRVSKRGVDPTSSSNKLDATTLATEAGSDGKIYREYVDGLPDPGAGAGEGGVTTTVSISFISDTAPVAGDEYTYDGEVLICTESEVEYAVGELVKGTATFVTKPPEDEE